jgi:hypothetical protein
VLFSYQCRFKGSVAVPSGTRRPPDKSSGSISPRFFLAADDCAPIRFLTLQHRFLQ